MSKATTIRNSIAGAIGIVMIGSFLGVGVGYMQETSYNAGLMAGLTQGEEAGIQKGKEAKTLELAEVFAPYGYQKIRKAKIQCEAVSGLVCQIYGGFAPKVDVKRELETKKTGPM